MMGTQATKLGMLMPLIGLVVIGCEASDEWLFSANGPESRRVALDILEGPLLDTVAEISIPPSIRSITDAALGPSGSVVIADARSPGVYVLGLDGELRVELRTKGNEAGAFLAPTRVAATDGGFAVYDVTRAVVSRFSWAGQPQGELPVHGVLSDLEYGGRDVFLVASANPSAHLSLLSDSGVEGLAPGPAAQSSEWSPQPLGGQACSNGRDILFASPFTEQVAAYLENGDIRRSVVPDPVRGVSIAPSVQGTRVIQSRIPLGMTCLSGVIASAYLDRESGRGWVNLFTHPNLDPVGRVPIDDTEWPRGYLSNSFGEEFLAYSNSGPRPRILVLRYSDPRLSESR